MSLRAAGAGAILAVFLGGSWAAAQDRAVRRGGGSGERDRGSSAGSQVRHPQAGTGYRHGYGNSTYSRPYYGGGYYSGYRGYYGGYRNYYRGYRGYFGGYRSYYASPYRYYGYPYFYASPWYGPYLSLGFSYRDYGYAPYSYADGSYGSGADYGEADNEREDIDAGRVVLEVRPEEAAVYVDDEFRGAGRSRHTLRLTPGTHRLEVVHPSFKVFTRELSVEPGDRMSLVVDLDRN